MARDKSQKAVVMKRHIDLLNERYDLYRGVQEIKNVMVQSSNTLTGINGG